MLTGTWAQPQSHDTAARLHRVSHGSSDRIPCGFCLSEDISGSSPFLLFPSHSFLLQHISPLSGCPMDFKRIMSSLEAGREQKETEALVMWGVQGTCWVGGHEGLCGQYSLELPTPSCWCWEVGGHPEGECPRIRAHGMGEIRSAFLLCGTSVWCLVSAQETLVASEWRESGTGLPGA